MSRYLLPALVLLFSTLPTCGEDTPRQPPPAEPAAPATPSAAPQAARTAPPEELKGLRLVVRESRDPESGAASASASAEKREVASGQPLDGRTVEGLFSRLPQISEEAGDRKKFALREGSLPPPKTGKTISDPFPPPAPPVPPPAVEQGTASVIRYQPEGDVPIARAVSVTFSAPMVPVGSHGDLAARNSPVKIVPEPPGKWRWIGTKTLLFEPETRFPMATVYEVSPGADRRLG